LDNEKSKFKSVLDKYLKPSHEVKKDKKTTGLKIIDFRKKEKDIK